MINKYRDAAITINHAASPITYGVIRYIIGIIGGNECLVVDALGGESINAAIRLTQTLLPGRTIEIVLYPDFAGCRIDIPGKEACCHMAKHLIPARAVVMALLSSLGGEDGQAQ